MSKFNMNVDYFEDLKQAIKWIRSAEKAIDYHNYQSAMHEVYLVTGDLGTVIAAFEWIAGESGFDEILDQYYWNIIEANTEYIGEVNYRYAFDGNAHYYENHTPHPGYNYIGKDNRLHEVVACFHF